MRANGSLRRRMKQLERTRRRHSYRRGEEQTQRAILCAVTCHSSPPGNGVVGYSCPNWEDWKTKGRHDETRWWEGRLTRSAGRLLSAARAAVDDSFHLPTGQRSIRAAQATYLWKEETRRFRLYPISPVLASKGRLESLQTRAGDVEEQICLRHWHMDGRSDRPHRSCRPPGHPPRPASHMPSLPFSRR